MSGTAEQMEAEMQAFLQQHQTQLVAAQVPERLWPVAYYKLKHEVFDAGNYFFLARDEDDDLHVVVRDDVDLAPMQPDSEEALFLVDHAWTFTAEQCLKQLNAMPPLLQRMENLVQISHESAVSTDERVRAVADRVWRYANTYQLGNAKPEKSTPIWYVMDEVGSAIEHGGAPNVRMAPFYFGPSKCAFSLVWTVESVEGSDFLARDYFPEQPADSDMRTALLAAQFYEPGKEGNDFVEELEQVVTHRQQEYTLEKAAAKFRAIVSRDSETHPDPATTTSSPPLEVSLADSEPLQLYTNLRLMYDYPKHPRMDLVESEEEAQIVWPTWHLKDFQKYAANERVQIINQFPNEKILTCKDLLFEMCKLQNGGVKPDWLAETYNMASEFPELMHNYILHDKAARAEDGDEGEANHWICKPWNMARSIDTCIAQNAAHLAKLTETGPKIACKYIHRPLLIDQRKFDLRFLVMVKSTEPLEVYVSGVYYLRIANKPFAMDDFQDFEKHYTVMNYTEHTVRIMATDEFTQRFDDEYPSEDWLAVHAEICASIKQLFQFATAQPPPLGLGRCNKSRALYGVDVMLSWETDEASGDERLRPVILEVNFQPDCSRPCKYYPHFYQDLMNVLVLGKPEDTVYGATRL